MAHFTNDFPDKTQIWLKSYIDFIQILMQWPLQQNKFSIECQFWAKNHKWNGSQSTEYAMLTHMLPWVIWQ